MLSTEAAAVVRRPHAQARHRGAEHLAGDSFRETASSSRPSSTSGQLEGADPADAVEMAKLMRHHRPLRRRRRQRAVDHQPDRPPYRRPAAPLHHRSTTAASAPGSLTFTGQLYGESTLLKRRRRPSSSAVGDHLKRPPLDRYMAEEAEREAKEKADAEKAAKDKEAAPK